MTRPLLTVLLLVSASACGPSLEANQVQLSRAPIVGGTDSPNDTNVFMVMIQGNNGSGALCTATLIAPRTLLLAAHCVDPTLIGATSIQLFASNAASEQLISYSTNSYKGIDWKQGPNWNPNTLVGDIALMLLDKAPPVTPKPYATNLAGLDGAPVRAVGYGITSPTDTGPAVRRTVDLTIRQMTAINLILGNQVDKGICHGDSGGPTFHTFADGVERVVGVHSYTLNQNCVDGADTRLDLHAAFIQSWLDTRETGPCAADGVCSNACPTPMQDVDCIQECKANGVCAQVTCTTPDPDCVANGTRCANDNQCASRHCVSDPQHGSPYCSADCTTDACPSGMECNATDHACRYVQIPPVTFPLAKIDGKASPSCASVPGGLWAMAALAGLWRRRTAHRG